MLNNWNIKYGVDPQDYSYIVKAKETNAEIKNTIKNRIKYANKTNIILTIADIILNIAMILYVLYRCKELIFVPIYFLTVYSVVYTVSTNWILRLKDNTIYVNSYFGLRHYNIDYSDLLNFQVIHYRLGGRWGRGGLPIYALVIEYIKNGKIKFIKLEIDNYSRAEIENLCQIFVTNQQLANNPDMYYYGYIDINQKNDEKAKLINELMKKLAKKEKHQILFYSMILFIMLIIIIKQSILCISLIFKNTKNF